MTEPDQAWLAWFEQRMAERERDSRLREENALLSLTLETAVPLWILEHRQTDPEERVERARLLAQTVASHGDDILYRSKRKGESARAFNALAEGIALLAYQPGGVKFLGIRWDAEPHIVKKES